MSEKIGHTLKHQNYEITYENYVGCRRIIFTNNR